MAQRDKMGHPIPNHNHPAEYQVSGIPFVTSSLPSECDSENVTVKVNFPAVTRWIVVQCTGSASNSARLKFGFTHNGLTSGASGSIRRYFVLKDGESSPRLEVKCKSLYFARHGTKSAGFGIVAGLTGCEATFFPILSGSDGRGTLHPLLEGIG